MNKYIHEKFVVLLIKDYAKLYITEILNQTYDLRNKLYFDKSKSEAKKPKVNENILKTMLYSLISHFTQNNKMNNIISLTNEISSYNIYFLTNNSFVILTIDCHTDNLSVIRVHETKFKSIEKKNYIKILKESMDTSYKKFEFKYQQLFNYKKKTMYVFKKSFDEIFKILCKYDVKVYNIQFTALFHEPLYYVLTEKEINLLVYKNNLFCNIQKYFEDKIILKYELGIVITLNVNIQNLIKN
jgi:hypothetical protein